MAKGNRCVQFLRDYYGAALPRSRGIVLKAQLWVLVLSFSSSGLRIARDTSRGWEAPRWQKNAANGGRMVLALPRLSRLVDLDLFYFLYPLYYTTYNTTFYIYKSFLSSLIYASSYMLVVYKPLS